MTEWKSIVSYRAYKKMLKCLVFQTGIFPMNQKFKMTTTFKIKYFHTNIILDQHYKPVVFYIDECK